MQNIIFYRMQVYNDAIACNVNYPIKYLSSGHLIFTLYLSASGFTWKTRKTSFKESRVHRQWHVKSGSFKSNLRYESLYAVVYMRQAGESRRTLYYECNESFDTGWRQVQTVRIRCEWNWTFANTFRRDICKRAVCWTLANRIRSENKF